MAPRKTRKSPSTTESNEGLDIVTDDKSSDQIDYYKKQIVLLQKELETCKNQILELKSENKILKNANANALNNDALKISINQKNNVYSKVRNNKVLSPSPLAKSKGCSCKGNCSNKICGCVKKNILCQEFCRCNDVQCQNQEPDKENVEQVPLTADGQKALEKLGGLTLNQESLHASEKKIKKSIFSPFVGRSYHNGNQESYPASPLVFETRRKLFSQDSDDLVDVDVNRSEHEKDELANKLESKPISSPVSKRTRKLKSTEKTNEENTKKIVKNPESMQSTEQDTKKNKNIKKTEKPSIVVHNDEEDKKDKIFVSDEQSKNPRSPRVLRRKSKSTSPVVHNDEEDKKDEIFVSNEQSKIPRSPRVLRRKSKSTSPDCNVVRRKYDKAKKVKSKSVSPKECITTKKNSENNQPKLGKVQHSPQFYNKQTSIKNVENIDNENEDKLTNEVKQENSLGISQSFESSTSGNTSNSSNHNDLIDSSLNPMMPKRQLARSPITAGTVIVALDKKRFSPPPKMELAVAEVDWEQHQSELVQCKKCKRKFFPHRVDTHVKSCKGT